LRRINLIIGVDVGRVQNNHFVMDLIKVQNLLQFHTKLKKQKKYFFVLVNKLTTNHFAMVHTVSKRTKNMNNILDLTGRVLISLIFLLSGINKIGNYEGTVGWMESLGVPGIFLIPAIILEIGAPISIMIGYKVKVSAALLSIFCIATAVIFHNNFSDQMQFISFMKNIALAGGFLFLVVNETKDFSLDKKLNSR
jgi:putative oxidoreductase